MLWGMSPNHPRSPADLEGVRRLVAHLLRGSSAGAPPPLSGLPRDLVRAHHLGPLAHRAGLEGFAEDYAAASVLARIRERHLTEAVRALGSARIAVALLKGISYAGWLYADPAARPMGDIDLLVRPAEHGAALMVLEGLGYRPVSAPFSHARWYHAVTLRRGETLVDLHRSIVAPLRSRIDLGAVWARARPAPEREDGALRLERADEALFHLVHVARHELAVPAIAWIDVSRLLENLDARETHDLDRRARQFRVRRGVRSALEMVELLRDPEALRTWSGRLDRAVLPSPAELITGDAPGRALQVLRKAYLVDGPTQLAGLAILHLGQRLSRRVR